MFEYSSLDYDNYYNNSQCQKENDEIAYVLNSEITDGASVVDLGAGTGLVASMIGKRCDVLQVEKDKKMAQKNKFKSSLLCIYDAADYVDFALANKIEFDYVTSLFALNYMRRGTLTKAAKLARNGCFFVVYDRPYLDGSASFYAGKKAKFWKLHWRSVISIDVELRMLLQCGYSVRTWNLCEEPYYKAVLIERKESL